MANVGAPTEPPIVDALTLVTHAAATPDPPTAGSPKAQEMHRLLRRAQPLPETELIDAPYINEAYQRVLTSDVRYQFAIVAKTSA